MRKCADTQTTMDCGCRCILTRRAYDACRTGRGVVWPTGFARRVTRRADPSPPRRGTVAGWLRPSLPGDGGMRRVGALYRATHESGAPLRTPRCAQGYRRWVTVGAAALDGARTRRWVVRMRCVRA